MNIELINGPPRAITIADTNITNIHHHVRGKPYIRMWIQTWATRYSKQKLKINVDKLDLSINKAKNYMYEIICHSKVNTFFGSFDDDWQIKCPAIWVQALSWICTWSKNCQLRLEISTCMISSFISYTYPVIAVTKLQIIPGISSISSRSKICETPSGILWNISTNPITIAREIYWTDYSYNQESYQR